MTHVVMETKERKPSLHTQRERITNGGKKTCQSVKVEKNYINLQLPVKQMGSRVDAYK